MRIVAKNVNVVVRTCLDSLKLSVVYFLKKKRFC